MSENKIKIRVCNLVAVGKLPFVRNLRVEEMNKILDNGKQNWNLIHQDSAPQLVVRKNLEGFNKNKKHRQIYLALWHSGKFHTTGAKNKKEIKQFYSEIIKEITKLCPRVFHD